MGNVFVVDRIIDDIVVLENLYDKSKLYVDKTILPDGIVDGSIVRLVNDSYILDKELYDNRRKNIRDRFNKLKDSNKMQ